MRKILSILLVGLLLYNMMGYSLVYLLESHKTLKSTRTDLFDKDTQTTVTIKVPVAIPYQTNWAQPEPAEGRISLQGQFYTLKTKQLINDTLYVQCEYDPETRDRFMELGSKITDEIQGQSSGKSENDNSDLLKSFLKEYLAKRQMHTFLFWQWNATAPSQTEYVSCATATAFASLSSPPPDFFC